MRKLFYIALTILLFLQKANAQVASDYAVLVSCTYDADVPSSITLTWPLFPTASNYNVYKKEKSSTTWGTAIATLPGDAITYEDIDIIADSIYEYQVTRLAASGILAYGYVFAGLNIKARDYRGKCLLVVDTTIVDALTNELYQFKKDISGDGWSVQQLNVARTMTAIAVKALITEIADADESITSVVLFGNVPVLYAGNIYPDGHPDHQGAWPADGIYGDIDVEYSDDIINNATATRPENQNIPGDGKLDQSVYKSNLELEVGRIDFYNLPGLIIDEATLLKNYLINNHNFRIGIVQYEQRALIDDNFGAFGGEAFASGGWRNFAPMFGSTQLFEADYFSTMYNDSYLWSYGCGGGWFQGASGVGTSYDFMIDTVKTAFTMLFGSYFGDYDSYDNFLRSSLASGATLTACWSGRPHWAFHQMALGENIGYSTLTTQNNINTYDANIFPKNVHIALLGDPTLRMHVVKPVLSVDANVANVGDNFITVDYSTSPDTSIVGYYVYRCDSEFGKYERLTATTINYSPYIDSNPINGVNYYMVKAVKLELTPSGTYYNTSIGITDSVSILITTIVTNNAIKFELFPNPASQQIHVNIPAELVNNNYTIISSEGKMLLQGNITSMNNQITINTLPEGNYTFVISNYANQFTVIRTE